MSWTHANLQTQGYRLGGDEARALPIGPPIPDRGMTDPAQRISASPRRCSHGSTGRGVGNPACRIVPFETAAVARPVTAVYNHITSTRLRR
jgi:hypothetical protein